jgi:hypothetical protein
VASGINDPKQLRHVGLALRLAEERRGHQQTAPTSRRGLSSWRRDGTIDVMKTEPSPSDREVLAGLVERVTYQPPRTASASSG